MRIANGRAAGAASEERGTDVHGPRLGGSRAGRRGRRRGQRRLLRAGRAHALAHARDRAGAARDARRGLRPDARRRGRPDRRRRRRAHRRRARSTGTAPRPTATCCTSPSRSATPTGSTRSPTRTTPRRAGAGLLQVVLSGLAIGAVYGLVGMGFAIAFYVTRVINFAEGQLLMVGVMVAAAIARTGAPPCSRSSAASPPPGSPASSPTSSPSGPCSPSTASASPGSSARSASR